MVVIQSVHLSLSFVHRCANLFPFHWKMLYIFVDIKPTENAVLHKRVKLAYRAVYNLLGYYATHDLISQ